MTSFIVTSELSAKNGRVYFSQLSFPIYWTKLNAVVYKIRFILKANEKQLYGDLIQGRFWHDRKHTIPTQSALKII